MTRPHMASDHWLPGVSDAQARDIDRQALGAHFKGAREVQKGFVVIRLGFPVAQLTVKALLLRGRPELNWLECIGSGHLWLSALLWTKLLWPRSVWAQRGGSPGCSDDLSYAGPPAAVL